MGCGGRGTGAAEQALTADRGCVLVAMGDAFGDQIESSHQQLKSSDIPGVAERVAVPPENRFTGFDAYQKVIDQVDLVLLTTPPGFRPVHFAYAVEKGKHAFIEKPVATDAPGLRMFLDAAKKSRDKGLSAVNGFCYRYNQPRRGRDAAGPRWRYRAGPLGRDELQLDGRLGAPAGPASSARRTWNTRCATGITTSG